MTALEERIYALAERGVGSTDTALKLAQQLELLKVNKTYAAQAQEACQWLLAQPLEALTSAEGKAGTVAFIEGWDAFFKQLEASLPDFEVPISLQAIAEEYTLTNPDAKGCLTDIIMAFHKARPDVFENIPEDNALRQMFGDFASNFLMEA